MESKNKVTFWDLSWPMRIAALGGLWWLINWALALVSGIAYLFG